MQTPLRIFWACLGGLSLALAVIGVALPLMPTVPFALLAAFCFARSSRRVHDWLCAHPMLGPPIVNWRENRAINRRAKILASLSFVGSVTVAALFLPLPPVALAAQVLILSACAVFIWTRPDA